MAQGGRREHTAIFAEHDACPDRNIRADMTSPPDFGAWTNYSPRLDRAIGGDLRRGVDRGKLGLVWKDRGRGIEGAGDEAVGAIRIRTMKQVHAAGGIAAVSGCNDARASRALLKSRPEFAVVKERNIARIRLVFQQWS